LLILSSTNEICVWSQQAVGEASGQLLKYCVLNSSHSVQDI